MRMINLREFVPFDAKEDVISACEIEAEAQELCTQLRAEAGRRAALGHDAAYIQKNATQLLQAVRYLDHYWSPKALRDGRLLRHKNFEAWMVVKEAKRILKMSTKKTDDPKAATTAEFRNSHPRDITTSLRFSIFRRDGFRCCLCGRTANDDVVLHVDHRVPVAVGGDARESNLWTLCSTCNHGKSDQVIPELIGATV